MYVNDTRKLLKLRVYNTRARTNEFLSASDAWLPPGTGLPANCTLIPAPEEMAGHKAVFDYAAEVWSVVEDHRGETVYEIATGNPVAIQELGPLPERTISATPPAQHQKWDGEKWVDDAEAAQKAEEAAQELLLKSNTRKRDKLLMRATAQAFAIQSTIDLSGYIHPEPAPGGYNFALDPNDQDKTKLFILKTYTAELRKVDVTLEEPLWPEFPTDML